MNKVSVFAGRLASLFAIAFFVLGTNFANAQPSWFHVVIGWCMMLAAFSGVVCLVSSLFGWLRNRKATSN